MKHLSKYALLGLALLTIIGCQKQGAGNEIPPPEIPVIALQAQEVDLPIEFVGQVYGSKDIAIRARVEGFLEGIHFQEGSVVKEGQLLYEIESQPYDADVAAQMSRVAEAKTMLAKATSDLNRIRPLAERKAVSQSDLDAAVAQYEASKASVEAAQANLKAAKIMLSYTEIHAPISGIIGKTNAKVGDFVGRGLDTVILNTISNTETIHVEFFLTENQYLQLARRYQMIHEQKILANPDGNQAEDETIADEPDNKGPKAPLSLVLADGTLFSDQGKFEFIDRQVDPTTGSILVQVSFPNPQKIIRPGQFAKIRTILDKVKDGILVPQRCVMEIQGRYRVFVVENDKAIERQVQVGPTIEGFRLIRDGLKSGEQVVYEGLQRLRDGMPVKPVITEITPNTAEKN